MRSSGLSPADLRVLATSVLERVELVAAGWNPRTADVAQVDELAVAVADLQEDFEAYVASDAEATDEEIVVLREIREGIAGALRIVLRLLEEASTWS